MAPPKYSELNLRARVLINHGFNYGHCKVECGVGERWRGWVQYNSETQNTLASITALHHWPKYGLTFKNKVRCDAKGQSEVVSEMSMKEQFSKGLKLTFQTSFMPFISKKSSLMMMSKNTATSYTSGLLHFDFAGTLVSVAHVVRVGEGGWHVGVKYDQSTTASLIHKSLLYPVSFTLAYLSSPLQASFSVSNQTEFQLTTHKRVSDHVNVAALCDWSTLTNQGRCVLAGKLKTDYGIFRLKGDSNKQLSASWQLEVTRKLSVLLSTQLQLNTSSPLNHKLGLGLKLNL